MRLKKKVLITAGATWVSIDRVRVITNTATGLTGDLLAQALRSSGASVSLIRGPMALAEFRARLFGALKKTRYDIIIQAAAVSDYAPRSAVRGKIDSDKSCWDLKLYPVEKIIGRIRKIAPRAVLVGFKFEPDASRARLIAGARKLMRESGCDLVVANTAGRQGYRAYIVSAKEVSAALKHKASMARKLVNQIT